MTIVNLSKITSFIKSFFVHTRHISYIQSLEKAYSEKSAELTQLKRVTANKVAESIAYQSLHRSNGGI
jgi:hypothetical protein